MTRICNTRQRSHIHWRIPASMIIPLVLATAAAIGQYQFYRSLDAEPVPQGGALYDYLSLQQVNTGIGIGFAFIVRACLFLAVSAAYMQLFFRVTLVRPVGFSVSWLDQSFSALTDIFSLMCLCTYKQPLLGIIAVCAWLLPIPTIFAPGALSTQMVSDYDTGNYSELVAQPAFESLSFVNLGYNKTSVGNETMVYPMGPSKEVLRIANEVAASGLQIAANPPFTNSSWTLQTRLPTLSCEAVDAQQFDGIKSNIRQALTEPRSCRRWKASSDPAMRFSYLAWTAPTKKSLTVDLNKIVPFIRTGSNSWVLQGTTYDATLSTPNVDLFIATLPRAQSPYSQSMTLPNSTGLSNGSQEMDWYLGKATIIHCSRTTSFFNLWYQSSTDGGALQQIIEVNSAKKISLDDEISFTSLRLHEAGAQPLQMTAFNSSGPVDGQVRVALRQWSYDAIFQAMLRILLGARPEPGDPYPQSSSSASNHNCSILQTSNTEVFSTSLADTIELSALGQFSTPQGLLQSHWGALTQAQGLLATDTSDSEPRVLAYALQVLFFNITVSMASSNNLVYNVASPFLPAEVNVKTFGQVTVYAFSSSKLWFTYGLAFSLAVINVGIGLVTMIANGAAFSASFSTVLQLGRYSRTDFDIHGDKLYPGQAPLSKALSGSTLKLDVQDADRTLHGVNYARVCQAGDDGSPRPASSMVESRS